MSSKLPSKFFLIQRLRDIIKAPCLSSSRRLFNLIVLSRLLVETAVETLIKIVLVVPYQNASFFFFKYADSSLHVDKNRKNVLCIIPHLVAGGSEKLLLNVAEYTDTQKFSFHVITTNPTGNVWRDRFEKNFRNVVTPMSRVKNPSYNNSKVYFKYFQYLIRKLDVSVVLISFSSNAYTELPRLKSEFPNLKIIDLLHAEDTPETTSVASLAPYIDRRICVSNLLKNKLIQEYRKKGLYKKYAERAVVIHNGINTTEYEPSRYNRGEFKKRFSIPNQTEIIAYIGRFAEEKNPTLFVEVARKIIARNPNVFKFVMAGDGPELPNVRNLVQNYHLQDQFILTGTIQNIPMLLRDTCAVLIVSKAEGIPFALLEAMSMGVPVISTDVGAIKEVIIDDASGYLVKRDDDVLDAFVSKIISLQTRENYRVIAEKARETITSGFTLEAMAREYQRVFDELTAG